MRFKSKDNLFRNYLQNKTILITGGSSGIGLALAKLCSAYNAHVIIIGRNAEKAKSSSEDIKKQTGNDVFWFAVDVTQNNEVEDFMLTLKNKYKHLDIVVNSAGLSYPGFLTDTSNDQIKQMISTNFIGTVNVCRSFINFFSSQNTAHIVNISSLAGKISFLGYAVYAGTKSAVNAFSEALRNELIPHHFSVSVVHPADVDTPMYRAEKDLIPETTKSISSTITPVSADHVADRIIQGLCAKKFEIFTDKKSYFLARIFSFFPQLGRAYLDHKVKQFKAAPSYKGMRLLPHHADF